MTKSRTAVTSAAASLAALVAVAAPCLPAAAATTAVSFTLSSGSLTVAPMVAADGQSRVVVQDSRGATLGWAVSGVVTGSGEPTAVSYASGPVTTTGTVTAISQGTTELGSTPTVLVVGTEVSGNNTASWTPTVTDLSGAARRSATVITYSVL